MTGPAELIHVWGDLLPAAKRAAGEISSLHRVARSLSSYEGYEALRKLQKQIDKVIGLDLEVSELQGL